MHTFEKINEIRVEDNSSVVYLFQDTTNDEVKFLPKGDYQRSIMTQIVSSVFCKDVEIKHKSSGAPYIANLPNKEISISHSNDLYALQISEGQSVGVDVQLIKEDLIKGKDYFVNEEEAMLNDLSNINLHLIWSAKEAVYKKYKGEIEKYKDGMLVNQINNEGITVLVCDKEEKLSFVKNEQYVLVYSS